jgi:chromosome segregation ATPase
MADEMTVNEQELVRHVETLQNKVEQLEGDLAMRDAEIDKLENKIGDFQALEQDAQNTIKDLEYLDREKDDKIWKLEQEIESLKRRIGQQII